MADKKPDEALLPCTESEMWQGVRDWAVLKEGAKRAIKCYDDEGEALKHVLKEGEYIAKRYTARTRCHNHCAVANHCRQHQLLLDQEAGLEASLPAGEEAIF